MAPSVSPSDGGAPLVGEVLVSVRVPVLLAGVMAAGLAGDRPLAGVCLVAESGGGPLADACTADDGVARLTGLPVGEQVTVAVTSVPAGYLLVGADAFVVTVAPAGAKPVTLGLMAMPVGGGQPSDAPGASVPSGASGTAAPSADPSDETAPPSPVAPSADQSRRPAPSAPPTTAEVGPGLPDTGTGSGGASAGWLVVLGLAAVAMVLAGLTRRRA